MPAYVVFRFSSHGQRAGDLLANTYVVRTGDAAAIRNGTVTVESFTPTADGPALIESRTRVRARPDTIAMQSSFTATYETEPADLVAFSWFTALHRFRWRFLRRLLYVCVYAMVGMGGLIWWDTRDPAVAVLTGLVTPLFAVPFYLLYLRSRVKRSVEKSFEDPKLRTERTIHLDEHGVRETSSTSDSFRTWDGLEFVGITATHLLLYETSVTAFIVPSSVLPDGALDLVRSHTTPSSLLDLTT